MKLCYAKTWRVGHRPNRSTVKLMSCTRADWINFSGQKHRVATYIWYCKLKTLPRNKRDMTTSHIYAEYKNIVPPISFFSALGLVMFRWRVLLLAYHSIHWKAHANRFWEANAHCRSILFIFDVCDCGMRYVGMWENFYQY